MLTGQVPIRSLKPWGNPHAMQQGPGYQINWERVSGFFAAGKQIVKANGAAAVGADAITVDALTFPLRAGDRIDFGTVETVLVKAAAAAIATAVSITVDALSGPVPAGTLLNFGAVEENVRVTTLAVAGATSIAVDPLPAGIEDDDEATYQGGENIVEVLEDTAEGATSVPVSNLEFALADNAEGIVQSAGYGSGDKFIPEATTMAIDETTTPFTQIPRRDADAEEASHLLASDASNSRQHSSHSRSGYGTVVGDTFLYENLLPDADADGNLPSAYKTELIANAHFKAGDFVDYVDTRA